MVQKVSEIEELGLMAHQQFDKFLETQVEKNPDLLLKFQITNEMRNEFIEGVLMQYWAGEKFNEANLMDFMTTRFKNIRR